MKKIVVRKSDNRLVSFGYEDTSRFDPADYDVIETTLGQLPDELRFCKYENSQVIVDEAYKQQILDAEAQVKQDRQEARDHIRLEELAGLSYQQIDNYIDNNVTSLANAKVVLKKLAKWNLALAKYLMIRMEE